MSKKTYLCISLCSVLTIYLFYEQSVSAQENISFIPFL